MVQDLLLLQKCSSMVEIKYLKNKFEVVRIKELDQPPLLQVEHESHNPDLAISNAGTNTTRQSDEN